MICVSVLCVTVKYFDTSTKHAITSRAMLAFFVVGFSTPFCFLTAANTRTPPPPRMLAAPPPTSPLPDPPPPSVYPPLLVTDCTAVAAYSLQLSSWKSWSLAISDLTSPGFSLADDLRSFDWDATAAYIAVEQFSAASLVLGWIFGATLCGACSEDWIGKTEANALWPPLIRAWAVGAPSGLAIKYFALSWVALPSLGRSAQAIELESQLSGLSAANAFADSAGMLAILFLWRQVLLRWPNLMPPWL